MGEGLQEVGVPREIWEDIGQFGGMMCLFP